MLDECCRVLADVRPWVHEVALYRRSGTEIAGDLIWVGPISDDIELSKGGTAKIPARDLAAWMDVRVVHSDHSWQDLDIGQIGEEIAADALAPDPSPGITLARRMTGQRYSLDVLASTYALAGERLRALAQAGLRWYAVRRTITFCGDDEPLVTLVDEHLRETPTVRLAGSAQATRVIVAGQGVGEEQAIVAEASATAPAAGLVERVSRTDAPNLAAAQSDADSWLAEAENPVAVVDSAILAESAPLTVADLLPGRIVRMQLSETCYPVDGLYRMTMIEGAVQSGNAGETITLHLTPVTGGLS